MLRSSVLTEYTCSIRALHNTDTLTDKTKMDGAIMSTASHDHTNRRQQIALESPSII